MVKKIIIKGRGTVKGMVEGEALVSKTHIHTFGVDTKTGLISETGHPQFGASIRGKVLVFPSPAGSSDWGTTFYETFRNGNGPIALINRRATTLVLNGAIATSTPMVVDFDTDPCEAIKTGDWVKVNADDGILEVTRSNKQ